MKKKILFIITLLLLLNSYFIFSSNEELDGKIINKIVFKGLKKAKKKEITPLITSKEGTLLDLMLIDQDYQRLLSRRYMIHRCEKSVY